MIEYTLNIGDVATSSQKTKYVCLGLGSCIGLFIQDRLTGISGGAHIFLPEDDKGPSDANKYYNVSSAVNEILFRFKSMGSTLDTLRAKVTGGSNVFRGYSDIGARNSTSVVSHLIRRKIFVAAFDTGGSYYRSATFDSESGNMTVRIPEINRYKIY